MQTHRFLIKPEVISYDRFKIQDPETINKALKVLRLSIGDKIELFDGQGGLYEAQIEEISENSIKGSVLEIKGAKEDKPIHLTLAQGLPKGSKLDDIVRMNTEVGVDAFVLFETDHSVIKAKDFNQKKLDRLNKLAQEAARQSERAVVPRIQGPITFDEMLGLPADHKLLLHSRIVDRTIDIKDLDLRGNVLAAIGPEGGFNDEEIQKAREKGFAIVHMDLPILRTETAGVVASAILST